MIDTINIIAGLFVGMLCLIMLFCVIYEVVARYFFNAPTLWSMEVNQYLFCIISLMGGGYCLVRDGHVRVDLLYPKLSAKGRAITDWCLFPLALLLCGLLVWFGWQETWDSIVDRRISDSVMGMPLWPAWFSVPVAGFLLGIQIISRLLGHIVDLKSSG